MNVDFSGRIRSINDWINSKLKTKIQKYIAIVVAITLVSGSGYWVYANKINPKNKNVAAMQTTAKVSKSDLSVTVTGSGPITSSNRLEITSKVEGTVTKVNFKEGDTVKAGDLLIEMDDSSAALNVEKVKANIADAQLTQNNNLNSINKLAVRVPFDGQVSNISIKEGDTLSKNAALFTLKDLSKLKVTVPFNAANYGQISSGMDATVYLQSLMQSVNGTVTYVGSNTYTTSMGGKVFDVEISIDNPGSLNEGLKASAEIDTGSGLLNSTNSGVLKFINSTTVKTDTGGTVSKINVREGQDVGSNAVAVELTNDDLLLTKDSYNIKMMDYQGQLDSANKVLSYYKVYAQFDGTIVKQTVKAGDTVKAGAIISTIADGNQLEFPVNIDELDVAKIKVGQQVNVTVDALTATKSKPLEGEVSKISLEGTTSNGVTTYPVTIKIKNPQNLRIGMNANAEIMVENKKGVLTVPIEAVTKISNSDQAFVWVKGQSGAAASGNGNNGIPANSNQGNANAGPAGGSGKTSQGSNGNNNSNQSSNRQSTAQQGTAVKSSQNSAYYANAIRKQVVLGISNESYYEIVSGLSEGDEVLLPQKTTSTSTSTNNRMLGGIGGMGGPPPSNNGGGNNRTSSGGSR